MKTRTSDKNQQKGLVVKLIPWFLSIALFFGLYTDVVVRDVTFLLTKLLPMLSLLLFVYRIAGLSRQYSKLVFIGLVFSTLGDALMVFDKDFFLPGMASFGVAHCLYITAFGFKRLRLWLGITLLSLASANAYLYSTIIPDQELLIGGSIYSLLLFTMSWRALGRFRNLRKISLKKDKSELFSAIGAVLFVIGDNLMAYQIFVGYFKYSNLLIMANYYCAQLFIALSTVEESNRKDY